LAIVKSLISLKASEDDQWVDLTNIQNQIDTIRLVHEKLQATEELSSIELIPYIEAVLQSVLDPTVETEITGFAVEVSSQVAVPLGLILNELATNAIKHGFTDNGEKRFVVEVRDPHSESSQVKIMVWNSGSPIPESVSFESPTSLGMRLVTQLVSQLGSTLAVKRGPNPTFEFEVESSTPPMSS
jgi:two-component sensor histidine kinase